jgi:hypothetical protein
MANELTRFYSLAVGIMGIIGLLARVSWQLGRTFSRIDEHIKDSAEDHKGFNERLTYLERFRSQTRPR